MVFKQIQSVGDTLYALTESGELYRLSSKFSIDGCSVHQEEKWEIVNIPIDKTLNITLSERNTNESSIF